MKHLAPVDVVLGFMLTIAVCIIAIQTCNGHHISRQDEFKDRKRERELVAEVESLKERVLAEVEEMTDAREAMEEQNLIAVMQVKRVKERSKSPENEVKKRLKVKRTPSKRKREPSVNRNFVAKHRLEPKADRRKPVFRDSSTLLKCSSHDPLKRYRGVPTKLKRDVDDFIRHPSGRDIDCGNGISLKEIMMMANSMLRFNKVFKVSAMASYSYLPRSDKNKHSGCAAKFYASGNKPCSDPDDVTCKRNWKDSEMYLVSDCPGVKEYWSAWTPCHFCQSSLLEWKYKRSRDDPITIHVGTKYMGGDKTTSTYCLALMIAHGFRFEPWSWTLFKRHGDFLPNGYCDRLVQLIQRCREFDDQYREIRDVIIDAENLERKYSRNELAKTYCPDPRPRSSLILN